MGAAFGIVVGLSLGLTGGGGSILAVPLLVYGLAVAPHEAVGVSLAAVGATALMGTVQRLRRGEVEIGVGLIFAAAGIVGAPVGAMIGRRVPDGLLLLLFAGLMGLVAARMWWRAGRQPEEARVVRASHSEDDPGTGPACRHDPSGRLHLTGRCTVAMSVVGVFTGVLSGLFGVGGGFIIVPALMFFSTLSIHRAVATSLLVIALIGASGVAGHVLAGKALDWGLTATFVAGGAVGMLLGGLLARRLSGPRLQRLFSIAIIGLALFIVSRHLLG